MSEIKLGDRVYHKATQQQVLIHSTGSFSGDPRGTVRYFAVFPKDANGYTRGEWFVRAELFTEQERGLDSSMPPQMRADPFEPPPPGTYVVDDRTLTDAEAFPGAKIGNLRTTAFEIGLAEVAGTVLLSDSMHAPPSLDLAALATNATLDALVKHRQHIGDLVKAIVDTIPRGNTTTYQLVNMKAEGWTPRQVRDVLDEYQALRLELVKARELIARVFAGEP